MVARALVCECIQHSPKIRIVYHEFGQNAHRNPRCQAPGRTSFLPRFRRVLWRYPPRVRAALHPRLFRPARNQPGEIGEVRSITSTQLLNAEKAACLVVGSGLEISIDDIFEYGNELDISSDEITCNGLDSNTDYDLHVAVLAGEQKASDVLEFTTEGDDDEE